MENSYEILNLFPIPLLHLKTPYEFSLLVPFFNSQPKRIPNNSKDSKLYGSVSLNSYILNSPECVKLKEYILKLALDFGHNILGYKIPSYKLSQSWISEKKPGQQHALHTHPNSVISGVLFYGNYENNTPSIIFHRNYSRPSNENLIQLPLYESNPNPIYSPKYKLSPKPGDLVLFPSYLPHSVPENTTNQIRKSLAFNIIPEKGLGEEISLSELKFN